ncbi:MAG: VWA domain-containing protein [Deltaproteobacteria bacterium]|nr:VWA domain-containing protein [Deltaproteobacteria bacterium]
MHRNPSLSVMAVVICAFLGLSLFNCTVDPVAPGGSGGRGGSGGSGAGGRQDAAVANTGGSGDPDAGAVTVKLDVIPGWWIEQDAWEPDVPPPPSPDAHCGITEQSTTRQPVDILLVLDRSGSMQWSLTEDCTCAGGGAGIGGSCPDTVDCTTPSRWAAVAPAVQQTLENSTYVNWGLKFFPSGGGGGGPAGGGVCAVNDQVEVAVGPDSATSIQSLVDSATFVNATPTALAIQKATAYLQGLADDNEKVILLATDGQPNCKDGSVNSADLEGATAACAAAAEAGIPVYVVGIGPDLDNLSDLAQAGGTNDYYQVNSPEQLADALTAISKIVGSCTYLTDTAPEDPDNVAVYVNKQLIEQNAADGWKYGSSTQEIVLTGSYCQDITDGKDTTVQILFGCPGAPPFEPVLP